MAFDSTCRHTPVHLDDQSKCLLAVAAAMSRPQDIMEQQRRIGAANKGQFIYPTYGHMDFVW
jgi:hypothetical protein